MESCSMKGASMRAARARPNVVLPEPEHPITDTRTHSSVEAQARALDRVAKPDWTACPPAASRRMHDDGTQPERRSARSPRTAAGGADQSPQPHGARHYRYAD